MVNVTGETRYVMGMTEMSHELDRDTASALRACTGDRWVADANVSSGWSIGAAPNGGYLAMLVARAMAHALEMPDPFTTTLHFLRVAVPGPARIEIEIVRRGRGHATAVASLIQEAGEVLRAISTFGDLEALSSRAAGPTDVRLVAPVIPPPEACDAGLAGPTSDLSITERADMRMRPGAVT